MSEYETPETVSDEHPLEGGQTDAVDEVQEDARRDADKDESSETDPSSMSASAARPGGGEQ